MSRRRERRCGFLSALSMEVVRGLEVAGSVLQERTQGTRPLPGRSASVVHGLEVGGCPNTFERRRISPTLVVRTRAALPALSRAPCQAPPGPEPER